MEPTRMRCLGSHHVFDYQGYFYSLPEGYRCECGLVKAHWQNYGGQLILQELPAYKASA
jgi:hypothetical protein